MADDDPFGILLSPPDDPNPYPHIRGDDRYFKTYDPFGTPMMNGSLPPAPPPSWRERRRVDYGRYMDRGGLFGAAWGMLPPEVRKSWATIPTLWAETTPGAGIRDTLDASGELTRAVMNADWRGALGGLGGMALGMVGSIPGGRAVTLPMDAASRMARADKMFPVEVFHGTAGDIRSFDPKRYGQTMPGPVSMTGVSVSPDPRVASHFAEQAGRRQEELIEQALALGEKPPRVQAGSNVMPLRLDPGKQITIPLPDDHSPGAVANAIYDAWEAGYDSVRLTNYAEVPGIVSEMIVVRRPEAQLRSRNAAFNPAKKRKGNLLDSLVPLGTIGGITYMAMPPPDDDGG